MSNTGFITRRKHFRDHEIDVSVREIAQKYFGDRARVFGAMPGKDAEEPQATWRIELDGGEIPPVFIYRTTKRRLEFPRPHGYGVTTWASDLFQHELAQRYEGRISDEGVEETIPTDVESINTYTKWMEQMTSLVPKSMQRRLLEQHRDKLSDSLQKTLGL